MKKITIYHFSKWELSFEGIYYTFKESWYLAEKGEGEHAIENEKSWSWDFFQF